MAALRIQKCFRGFLARMHVSALQDERLVQLRAAVLPSFTAASLKMQDLTELLYKRFFSSFPAHAAMLPHSSDEFQRCVVRHA